MNTIPLAVILIPFAIFVIIFLLFSIFNVFHLLHYGIRSTGFFAVLIIYALGTVFLFGTTFIVLHGVDWQLPIDTQAITDQFQNVDPFHGPTTIK